MPNALAQLMPRLARHEGRWTGIYRQLDPQGSLTEQYRVDTLVEFPNEPACDFRLNVTITRADGSQERGVYGARYADGRLHWNAPLTGMIWEVDDFTVYLRFGYVDASGLEVCEMIQISDDGKKRARTWHWFRDQALFQITLCEEWRPE